MPFISLRSFSPTGVIVTEENGMTEGEKGWDEESVRPNLTSFPCHCHPLVQPSSLCRSPGVSSPVSSRSLCSAPHLTVRFLTSFSPYDWRWMRREKRPTIEPEAGTKWPDRGWAGSWREGRVKGTREEPAPSWRQAKRLRNEGRSVRNGNANGLSYAFCKLIKVRSCNDNSLHKIPLIYLMAYEFNLSFLDTAG